MAEDYSISAKITADASGFEKGIDKAQKASKNLSKSVSGVIQGLGKNGLVGALGAVGLASAGVVTALNTAIKVIQKVGQTVKECTEAYKKQIIAERQLNTAIQNNSYISGASVNALKQFASEMQKVSNYGDEELIPMMANLVSLGRTESETMKIMSVAMDMSASGSMSLDSAITQLNATLNGSVGRLGQQNAELKDLTAEELKSGKAIEILGQKFKGLASATVDTSKQLQNIKGDFKEVLGEFSLPSSDMWNKFWAGFYEKGIQVISRFNDYLDVKIIGKQLVENIYNNARTVAKSQKLKVEDVLGDLRYVREELSYLTDSELATLQKTLERQKERTKGEERILATVKQMLRNKELEADQERANAEAEAKRARAEAERNAKEKELAEFRKKQEEEKKKALKIEGEWQDKLFATRLENLEKTREKELENEELTYEQKIGIAEFYGEQILAMKLKQIEKEREEALKQDNLTEEARNAINLYYENKITQAKQEESDKRLAIKKNEIKEEKKEEENYYAEMLKRSIEATKRVGENVANVAKKVVSTIKNIFSSVVNIFSKIFEFKPDDVLDNILKFEDSVLTFFAETLQKTPNFFESVFQSISVLIRSIRQFISADDIRQIVRGILKLFTDNLPQIIDDLVIIVEELIDGVIDGLIEWLDSDDGLEKLFKLILQIQKSVEKLVVKLLTRLADLLEEHEGDFADFMSESMTSANNTLPKLIDAVLRIIGSLIRALAEAFRNKEFTDSITNAIIELTNSIMDNLPEILGAVVNLIVNLITALTPRLPEIINALVDGLADAIPKCLQKIISGLASGFGQIVMGLFKEIFTWDFWKDALKTLGEVLTTLVADIFSGGLASLSGGAGSVTGNTAGDIGLGLATGGISYLGHIFGWWAKGTNNAPAGLSIVGEAGPELVKFRGGEQVLNNRNTNKALAEMGGKTNNFNVTFNNLQDTSAFNMMQQLKAYNRQLAVNGII